MASRSARSRNGRRLIDDFDDEEGGVAAFLMRNRTAVGGLTAFAVAFAYVAANALWYQPLAHGSAFFSTRPASGPDIEASRLEQSQAEVDVAAIETIIRIEREKLQQRETATAPVATSPATASPTTAAPAAGAFGAAPAVKGDPVVEEVQRILAGLNLYPGTVDGLTGPQTRSAIEAYRKMVGLSASAEIDDQLLAQLGARPRSAAGAPPLPQGSPGTDMIETSSAAPRGDAIVMRIQAGLKAFGNDGIEIDGMVGSRTRAAILEFQSLFGLPETGEPDQTLYAKMRDIGLTD